MTPGAPPVATIARIIQGHVSATPHRVAVTLVSEQGGDALAYGHIHSDACAMAHQYTARQIGRGDVITISLPLSRELIAAVIGAFYIGAIPAILPSDLTAPRRPAYVQQFRQLVLHAKAAGIVVAHDRVEPILKVLENDHHIPSVLSPEASASIDFDMDLDRPGQGNDSAYLQYTSGTTGLRKGALLSHTAIAACVSEFAARLQISANTDVIINWLPLYHDFGLVAGLLTPLLTATPTVLLAPERCMRRPHELMRVIHTHGGTLCWATNSALHFFAEKTSEQKMKGIDLSGLRVLCTGGEPTRFQTLSSFADRFAVYGLKREALMSGYGMAETTMGVAVCSPSEMPVIDWIDNKILQASNIAVSRLPHSKGAIPFVSNGTSLPSTDIRIVDDAGKALPDRSVGMIMVRGKTVMNGYHNNPQATRAALREGWLTTNDTGFLAEGHLYVIGRKDDRIMVGGKTIQPEDLEALVTSLTPLTTGNTVVFGDDDTALGTEKVIMVCGMKDLPDCAQAHDLEMEIRALCKQHLDCSIATVLFVHKGWIVKAANGKMARQANRAKYLAEFSDRAEL